MITTLPFIKYQALGNDYLVVVVEDKVDGAVDAAVVRRIWEGVYGASRLGQPPRSRSSPTRSRSSQGWESMGGCDQSRSPSEKLAPGWLRELDPRHVARIGWNLRLPRSTHHRGDDDAWNIAAILAELLRRQRPE